MSVPRLTIPPVLDGAKTRQQTHERFLALRELFGTEPYVLVQAWIDALIAEQQAYMSSCGKDRLPDAQVRIRLLSALASSLASKDMLGTGHVFD